MRSNSSLLQRSSVTPPTSAACLRRQQRNLIPILALAILTNAVPGISASKSENFNSAISAGTNGWVELGSRENGQDFGFSDTTFAGGPAGEAGGTVKRDPSRSEYVDVFGGTTLTLDDAIHASGRISIPDPYTGNLGHLIGHSDSRLVGQESQANQMGLLVASSGTRFNVHLSLANAVRRESVVVLPTLTQGTVYDWEYHYDPAGGASGNGSLTVHVISDGVTNTGVYELTAGDRATGAEFDSFGLTSRALSASEQFGTAYIDDVSYTVPDDYIYVGVPVIRQQPQGQTVAAGLDAFFFVRAIGGDLHYQWLSNSVVIPGAIANFLALSNVSAGPSVTYSVIVSNSFGTTNSADAILKVTSAPLITAQPQNVSIFQGGDATFSVEVLGDDLSYQWRVNGVSIAGATESSFTVANVQPDLPSAYSVTISNPFGVTNSTEAILTVTATNIFNTEVMTNIWDLLPGDRFYLTPSGNSARGLAYHALSQSVIAASRSGGNAVVSLDAATGTEQHFMDTTLVSGGTLPINLIGVADDGAIYVANLTTSATNLPYVIYRWPTNDPFATPTIAFSGDPGGTTFPGLRWGDSFTVRGGGTNTQILITPGNIGGTATNVVAILRTADGVDFQNSLPPVVVQITNAQTGFANLGLAFGPGTNTFFAKMRDFPLVLVEFDLENQVGWIQRSYSFHAVPETVNIIGVDLNRNLLAALAVDTPDNVRLYGIADLSGEPQLLDQEAFAVNNANTTAGGPGAVAFGGDYVFVLNNNNGVKAFQLNSQYAPPAAFSLDLALDGTPAVVLSWQAENNRLYQVWAKNSLTDPAWGKIGSPVLGTGGVASVTNAVPGVASRIYRVQGQ